MKVTFDSSCGGKPEIIQRPLHIIETEKFTGRSGGKKSLDPGDISENTACCQIQERHQMDRSGKRNPGKSERSNFFLMRGMLMRMGLPVHFLRTVFFRKRFSFPGDAGIQKTIPPVRFLLTVIAGDEDRRGIVLPDFLLNRGQLGFTHILRFGKENRRTVGNLVPVDFIKVLFLQKEGFGIHDGQRVKHADLIVVQHFNISDQIAQFSHAGGLYDENLRVHCGRNRQEIGKKIRFPRTAHAILSHFPDSQVLGSVSQHLGIHIGLAELILENRKLPVRHPFNETLDESRFSRAQKTGNNQYVHEGILFSTGAPERKPFRGLPQSGAVFNHPRQQPA